MTTGLRNLLLAALLLVAVASAAFAPKPYRSFGATITTTNKNAPIVKTALQFGFLKKLGLEKPDWLPDFGGEKEEDEAPAATDGEESDSDAESSSEEVVASAENE